MRNNQNVGDYKGVTSELLFLVQSLDVEYNIHYVALHLFAVLFRMPSLAYFWTKHTRKAVGTNLIATPSRVGWLGVSHFSRLLVHPVASKSMSIHTHLQCYKLTPITN